MIALHHLRVARGLNLIAENFSLAVTPGAGVWLTGANGSGKTSLLRAAAGLLPVLEGSVACEGGRVFIGTPAGHDAALTAYENLEFWRALHGANRMTAADALEAAGLAAVIHKPAGMLSAGQGQRLALARLLCSPAKAWLLDEPFAALDADGQAWLQGLIAAHLRQGGGMAVIATHHIYDVSGMKNVQVGA